MNYKIWVRCPKCGRIQRSSLAKSHTCVYCGSTFVIFPKRSKSRVAKVEGDFQAYLRDVQSFLRMRR